MDAVRQGDVSFEEFYSFFADGNKVAHQELQDLANVFGKLFRLISASDLSINEIFAAFDRNGSGSVSVSEFCSIVQVLLRSERIEKSTIYKSFLALDSSVDKTISLKELSLMIHAFWKYRLDFLKTSIPSVTDNSILREMLIEKEKLKAALNKNFNRAFRQVQPLSVDSLEEPLASILRLLLVSASKLRSDYQNSQSKVPSVRSSKSPTAKLSASISAKFALIKTTGSFVLPYRSGFSLSAPKVNDLELF